MRAHDGQAVPLERKSWEPVGGVPLDVVSALRPGDNSAAVAAALRCVRLILNGGDAPARASTCARRPSICRPRASWIAVLAALALRTRKNVYASRSVGDLADILPKSLVEPQILVKATIIGFNAGVEHRIQCQHGDAMAKFSGDTYLPRSTLKLRIDSSTHCGSDEHNN